MNTTSQAQSHSARARLRPNSLDYYLHFGKAGKKIGSLATKGYFQVRELLEKDLSFPRVRSLRETPAKDHPASQHQETVTEEVDELVQRANHVLAEASTVFPFTLFPDTVTVDRTKLTITQRTFFMTSHVITIHIEDVLNVAAHVGPLFGSLVIAIKGLTSEDHFRINFFWRKDAIHLKHVIQGHIIAQHDKIDYRRMEHKKLLDTLVGLGHDSNS